MLALGTERPGASLVELMVALALFGVIGTATLRALDRQARFHHGMLSILESRTQHAAAHEAISTELRSVSTAAGDVSRLSDSAIVFRLPVGSGVVCRLDPAIVDLAPDSVAVGQRFASTRTSPQPGDTAWVLDEGVADTAGDDTWVGLPVIAVARRADRCLGTSLVDSTLDRGRLSWSLTVSASPPSTVAPGAPIRLTRPARFALYRGGNGEYALGFSELNPSSGSWIAIQPVSGPYVPYNSAAPGTGGLAFAGRDSSGTVSVLLAPGTPASIAIATRTLTARAVRIDGLSRGRYADSLHSLIAMRNTR